MDETPRVWHIFLVTQSLLGAERKLRYTILSMAQLDETPRVWHILLVTQSLLGAERNSAIHIKLCRNWMKRHAFLFYCGDGSILLNNIVSATLDNTCSRNEGDFSLLLKFLNRKGTAVTHSRTHLAESDCHIIL